MKLYLDLNKAQQYSAGTTTKKEEQTVASNAESYVSTTSGVSNTEAGYDRSDVGKKWSHGEDEKLDNEVEKQRQERNKKAQSRNLVPTKEEVGKSERINACDLVKSINVGMQAALETYSITDTERDFLHLVKGYSLEVINTGQARIMGSDRRLFTSWLCKRAQQSLNNLLMK